MDKDGNRIYAIVKKLLFEPLVHFLVAGGLLYLYFDATNKNPTARKRIEIPILQHEADQLARESGLDDAALLMEYLKYRKSMLADAYALELEKDDTTIEKRLLKKRESILNASSQIKEPSRQELMRYYNEHREDFSRLLRLDLLVVRFDRGVDVDIIKKLVVFGDLKKAKGVESLKDIDRASLQKRFGRYTLLKIESTPQGYWSEPLVLQDGVYIFRVDNKRVGEPKPFEEVEDDVYREYLYTKRMEALRRGYEQMLGNYRFKVVQ